MSFCGTLLDALQRGEVKVCSSLRLSSECEGAPLAEIDGDTVRRACRAAETLRSIGAEWGKKLSLEELSSLDDDIIEALLDPLVSPLVQCIISSGEKGVRFCEAHASQG